MIDVVVAAVPAIAGVTAAMITAAIAATIIAVALQRAAAIASAEYRLIRHLSYGLNSKLVPQNISPHSEIK